MTKQKPKGSLISYFSQMVSRGGGINLAQGKPGFPPPAELLDILKTKIDEPALHQYAPGNGDFHLLELLANHYAEVTTQPLDQDNLLIVQGATEGLTLAFIYLLQTLPKPFSALSFDPVYESYPKLPGIFDIPFIYTDLEKPLTELDKIIQKNNVKIIFIASPGNPLGKSWSRQEMESMVALADKHGCYIIFDAVYKDIYFDEAPYNPLELGYDRLFYIDSFSKMLSITGWRIGYMITTKEHMVKLRDIHDYTGLSAVSIFQRVIVEYLEKFSYGAGYLKSVRQACQEGFHKMKASLEALHFLVAEAQGGYFLWARLPEKYQDAFQFAMDLYMSSRVGVVPGENFSPVKKNYLRLNIAQEQKIIIEAAARIVRAVSVNF